ncbi:inositol 2-dehydrogenase [Saccharibacillus sp. CPCC 101409]|uniref:inositol 2-dehydrogenase n=1 Tax=Saccharibacillus sp. CPCC 101409 TaxID=3058041 RepID=UPI00267264D9|nr:inositol 2-dehydrogenase [Saccharibacillus sp. CPCC 101409]MDO3409256.1 inositol 2-dehydrogenase [Saccharibacillus sp. CPCC 101409]
MTNLVEVGIIGAGRIGRLHAEHLLRMPQFALRAIADPFAGGSLREWAEHNRVSVYGDGRELLDDPRVAAVFICTPTDSHADWIKRAAAAGKHIFCEKPVSRSREETEQALRAAEEAGVVFQVGFNRRMDPSFRRLKTLVEAGELGRPHILKITSRDPQPPGEEYIRSSGGMFTDMTIHDFDMARYLMNEEVTEVYARGANLIDPVFGRHGDVDTAIITLTFESGAVGVIDNSRQAVYGYDQRIEVFGALGAASADNWRPTTVEVSTAEAVTRDRPLHFFLERYERAFIEEAAAFADSVLRGSPVVCSGMDGMKAEAIAEAALESHRTGLPVKLPASADRKGAQFAN